MADIAEVTDPEGIVDLSKWVRWLGAIFGLGAGATGGIAVFRTTNGAGASTLIVVAVAFLLMAVTGRIPKITFPGGGGVSYDIARALTHEQQLGTALEKAGQGKEEEADAIMQRTLADVAQHRGIVNPDQAANLLRPGQRSTT
jgi:voltage-gated potassium channel Kch